MAFVYPHPLNSNEGISVFMKNQWKASARAVCLSPSKRFTRTDGKPAKDRNKLGGKERGRDYRSYLQLTHKPAFPVLTLPSSRVFADPLGGGGR